MKWDSKINWIDRNLFKNTRSGVTVRGKVFNLGLETQDIEITCKSNIGAYIKDRYSLLILDNPDTSTFILKNIYVGDKSTYHKFIEMAGGDLSDFKEFSYLKYLMNKKEAYYIAFEMCPEAYSYDRNKSIFIILNSFNMKDLLSINISNKKAWAPIPSEA